jgi:AcrR family transcriptional regulator
MPRIETETLAQHRDWRRNQLIEAAASIALESGGAAVTVAAVAQRAGLSRTSVYEYFSSSADLVADLVLEEINDFAQYLQVATSHSIQPRSNICAWIEGALLYIADGRHLLAKALNASALPQERVAAIGAAHRALLAPLVTQLTALGVKDTQRALLFIQAITDVSTKRIESGNNADAEIKSAQAFCIAGLATI